MTLNTGIFDVSDPQNPDREYSAALLSRMMAKHIRDGIVHGDGNEMAVTVTDPPAMSVQVGTGTAMIRGRFCENDAALTLSVPAAHATYPRIDRVVVRLNASPARTIDILNKTGTPAPSPVPPGLTRTPETWELSLAQVRVEAGATSILSAKITDERGNASLCGVACPAYIPSSVLEIVAGVEMQGLNLVGLPTPKTSTAAATKGYVDSEIAGKISGFGISDIAIDEDKDWNGKNITNVGTLQNQTGNLGARSQFVDVPGTTTTRKSSTISMTLGDGVWTQLFTVTVPATYSATENSNARIIVTISGAPGGITTPTLNGRVTRNGTEIGTATASFPGGQSAISGVSVDTTGGFKAGDVLVVEARWNAGGTPYTSVTATTVAIMSTRSTEIAAKKEFVEAGAW